MSEISEIQMGDSEAGPDRYRLVCDGCGQTFDVEPVGVDDVTLAKAQRHGMRIDTVEVVFRGRCKDCA